MIKSNKIILNLMKLLGRFVEIHNLFLYCGGVEYCESYKILIFIINIKT